MATERKDYQAIKQWGREFYDVPDGHVKDLQAFYERLRAKSASMIAFLAPTGSVGQGVVSFLRDTLEEVGPDHRMVAVTHGTKAGTAGIITETLSEYFPVLAVYPRGINPAQVNYDRLAFWFEVPPVLGEQTYWPSSYFPLIAYVAGLVCFGGGRGTAATADLLANLNDQRLAGEEELIGQLPQEVAIMTAIRIQERRPRVIERFLAGDYNGVGNYGVLDRPYQLADFIKSAI